MSASPKRVIEFGESHPYPRPGTSVKQDVRGSFCDHQEFIAVLVIALDRRHHLALGRERDFSYALETPLAPLGDAQLALSDQERSFSWIALDLPDAPGPLAQVRIASQAATAQDHDLFVTQRPLRQFGTFVFDRPCGG